MSKEDISFINIIYNINEKDKEYGYIKIFGSEFVKNNINKCKILLDNKEYEISEKYYIQSYNKNKLEIKLKRIDNVTNMSYMFSRCTSFSSLPDILKLNKNNVTNMSYLFSGCTSLASLPDISEWNADNITNISYFFHGCSSLSSLPDISK